MGRYYRPIDLLTNKGTKMFIVVGKYSAAFQVIEYFGKGETLEQAYENMLVNADEEDGLEESDLYDIQWYRAEPITVNIAKKTIFELK